MFKFLLVVLFILSYKAHQLEARLQQEDEKPGDGHDNIEFVNFRKCEQQWRPPVNIQTGNVIKSKRSCQCIPISTHDIRVTKIDIPRPTYLMCD